MVLSDDISRAHRKLVVGVVREVDGSQPASASDYFTRLTGREVGRFRDILAELKDEESVGLAAVSVAARDLSALADRVARRRVRIVDRGKSYYGA